MIRKHRPYNLDESQVPLTEQKLTRAIVDAMNATSECWVWRNNRGSRGHTRFGGPPGASDILGIRSDGRAIAIEVKMPGSSTDPKRKGEQAAFLDRIHRMGGVAGYARSVEDALGHLRRVVG